MPNVQLRDIALIIAIPVDAGANMSEPISSALLLSGAKTAIDASKPAIQSLGQRAFDKLKVGLTDCFTSHIVSAADRCRKIKNIMYKDEPVELLTQYVPVSFKFNNKQISDSDTADNVISGKRILLSGRAGFGKTMFMKWATIRFIDKKENHQRYPLFLELRYMTERDADIGLKDYIFKKTSIKKAQASIAQFELGLQNGLFIIILDAVDEVNPSFRDKVISDIRDMMRDYPSCPFLISTRPDEMLEALQEFSVLHTIPMTKNQTIQVINNLDYDNEVKKKLTNELESGLFEKHKGFLSNPLLATIMLLTYDHSADIPNKITSFYKEAFEVLYQRHDAHKGTFRRGHHAGLPMDEFELIFSIFCYKTYVSSRFEFSDSQLLSAFRDAIEFSGKTIGAELIVRDSIESASLLQKEGLENTFVHRSFQEYFTALFISNYRGPNAEKLLDVASISYHGGNMLSMLLEINEDLLEYEWLLPKAEKWLGQVKNLKLTTKTGLKAFLKATISSFGYVANKGRVSNYSLDDSTAARWMSPINDIYAEYSFSSKIFESKILPLPEMKLEIEKHLGVVPENFDRLAKAYEDSIKIDEDNEIRFDLTFNDANWILYSDIPDICSSIRKNAHDLVEKIKTRRDNTARLTAKLIRS